MKFWRYLFCLFFILFVLNITQVHASKSNVDTLFRECLTNAQSQLEQSKALINSCGLVPQGNMEEKIVLLEQAISCCKRAIKTYNEILNHKDAKKDRSKQAVAECKAMIEICNQQISYLTSIIDYFKVFDNIIKKIAEADSLRQQQSYLPSLNEILLMIANLESAKESYDKAIQLCEKALSIIQPFPMDGDKSLLKNIIIDLGVRIKDSTKEIRNWNKKLNAEKQILTKHLVKLKEKANSLDLKSNPRDFYELYKQMGELTQVLMTCGEDFENELNALTHAISTLEIQIEVNPKIDPIQSLSEDDFWQREELRRENFFRYLPINSVSQVNHYTNFISQLTKKDYPIVISLNGQSGKSSDPLIPAGMEYSLYSWQSHQFLVQHDSIPSNLLVQVYQGSQLLHEEKIAIPRQETEAWSRYLTDGMMINPNTALRKKYGLNLRLIIVQDPHEKFSMEIIQKGSIADYRYVISFEETPLYQFRYIESPPWQLDKLIKSDLNLIEKPIDKSSTVLPFFEQNILSAEVIAHRILKDFVEELNRDPLAITQYVYNEIDLVDPFLLKNGEYFYPPKIHRSPYGTFLEKQGSAWEQCSLLVELLRLAGYRACFANGTCLLPHSFAEKMLFTEIPGQKDIALNYPWVLFLDHEEPVSLFPWMKELQVHEGFDLYSLMPEEYATADRWILKYLTNDEQITRHIRVDSDDTAGVLFVRFVEEQLRKQNLSLDDVGMHRSIRKRQYVSWNDFLRPQIEEKAFFFQNLSEHPALFAKIKFEISSKENPDKKTESDWFTTAEYNLQTFPIHFSTAGIDDHVMHFGIGDNKLCLKLDQTDQTLEIKVNYENNTKKFSIAKGTSAAFCFYFGGINPKIPSVFAEQFKKSAEEERIHSLLSFIGMNYFEKCSRAEADLAKLHKVCPKTYFGCGLAKLAPDLSHGSLKGTPDLVFPQVDMKCIYYKDFTTEYPFSWHQEKHFNDRQYAALVNVDFSSNEHQVLREVFQDPHAISTVKLLQIAHQEHQDKGLKGIGFLVLTKESFSDAEESPELAQCIHFPHLKDLNLKKVKASAGGQWRTTGNLLGYQRRNVKRINSDGNFAYAYMTPGPVCSRDGNALVYSSYKGMGTLVQAPREQSAMISDNSRILNGGFGSKLPDGRVASITTENWTLVPYKNTFTLVPITFSIDTNEPFLPLPGMGLAKPNIPFCPGLDLGVNLLPTEWAADVRLEHKGLGDSFADPVDIVTGAFYIDEIDLSLPGVFPLEIRRNYNSQSPIYSSLGFNWKLGLNPELVENEDTLLAAEEDGTIIVYRFNSSNFRWEVLPEDNPELRNYSKRGMGGTANPFHAYIEHGDVYTLYGSDGSKRIFDNYRLQKWIDHAGNTLTFSYKNEQLSRIESSNGGYLGFCYNHEGLISEGYTKDGRRVYYAYDSQGNLTKVTLPNNAIITYEYDLAHRIVTELKPHGHVLKNHYDNLGRVDKQYSPIGPQQEMLTSSTFDYLDGLTIAKDAAGSPVKYYIFQKQIYKTIDPEGNQTLQSWFIDERTWFNAETASIQPWNQPGGWTRSLKETKDKRGLITRYLYDLTGNPKTIALIGEDLTGNGDSEVAKDLTYNEHNLCTLEETLNKTTIITYDANFPYLPRRIEKQCGGVSTGFTDFTYTNTGSVSTQNHSGAITNWYYDLRGFPLQKVQETGTEDPDVSTNYRYNDQGQCIEVRTASSIQQTDYDIMGNPFRSYVYNLTGEVLSASFCSYNLNNQLIWTGEVNALNTTHFDYNASGKVKALRKSLSRATLNGEVRSEDAGTAYTLFDYDPRGLPIRETDPLGNFTLRTFDHLGRVIQSTKQGLSTSVSYEAGGLIADLISPGGGKKSCFYTTNGLLKKEVHPDGTENTTTYDFSGRPVTETYGSLSWEITYDDAMHKRTRTHTATGISETQIFDQRGSCIRSINGEGYAWTKEYDGLNRIISEIAPDGRKTTWNYVGDQIICHLSNGETQIQRFEGNEIVESQLLSSEGILLSETLVKNHLESGIREEMHGETTVYTCYNTFGLPVIVKQGPLKTIYQYDFNGNCISTTDGEGRTTTEQFDSLGRPIQKKLPDGAVITYEYDADSNLTASHMPGGITWIASYDLMKRKCSEEVQANGESTQQKQYNYSNGQLTSSTDSLNRIHTYLYDSLSRPIEEHVDGRSRLFSYDKRGLLLSAEQFSDNHSVVNRTYDPCGRIIEESTFLNSVLLQETHQSWDVNQRTVEIEDHVRHFEYQAGKLKKLSSNGLVFNYDYTTSRQLASKKTLDTEVEYSYHSSSLPKEVRTNMLSGNYLESMNWDCCGKLSSYESDWPKCQAKNTYSYNPRGFLKSTLDHVYEFDFGTSGRGVRTSTEGWKIPTSGLNSFGNVIAEFIGDTLVNTTYDNAGSVSTQFSELDNKQFKWDPWERLIKVTSDTSTWETSYDALGRRLQTTYTQNEGLPVVTTSLYDPESEFLEIGIKSGDNTFWKLYSNGICEAILDQNQNAASLIYDPMNNLIGVVYEREVVWSSSLPSPYGAIASSAFKPSDNPLLAYAQSLNWQGKAVDPTGLIWMGARYYDPLSGRFLSPDPLAYPNCLDLYAYANGDPVNFNDPDGRCACQAFQTTSSFVIDNFENLLPSIGFLPWYTFKDARTKPMTIQSVGDFSTQNKKILFTNGVDNSLEDAIGTTSHFSNLIKNHEITLVHNPSRGLILDLCRWWSSCKLKNHSRTVEELHKEWNNFLLSASPAATLLQLCHSEGVTNVRNALISYDENLRKRIDVIALCPSAYIEDKYCRSITHYCNVYDPVHQLVNEGFVPGAKNVVFLRKESGASVFSEHDAQSPSLINNLTKDMNDYLTR